MFVRELRVSYKPRRDITPAAVKVKASNPSVVADLLSKILTSEPVEVFIVVCLDGRNCVSSFREVARGTVTGVHVSAAEVFKTVLLANSPAFVVAHNHPSGDTSPSRDDHLLTQRLVAGAALLDVVLLDHVIVGDGRFYSFKEGGQL